MAEGVGPVAEVAVVIPAYNAAKTLPETLRSLVAQTFDDFDAVVVDDGSTDATAAIAAAAEDPRVRVLSFANGGVARARNLGIAATKSPLVAFLDADDLWAPQKLELQVEALRGDPDAEFCVTGAMRIDANARSLGAMPLERPEDVCAALLLRSMIVGCLSSGLARRRLLERVGGFDTRFSQSADWDLWLKAATSAKFVVIPEPLVSYRSSPGNMSSDVPLLERDTFAVLDSFYDSPASTPYLSLRPRVLASHWLVCSGSYLHAGRLPDALRCLRNAARAHPPTAMRALGMPVRRIQRWRERSGTPR